MKNSFVYYFMLLVLATGCTKRPGGADSINRSIILSQQSQKPVIIYDSALDSTEILAQAEAERAALAATEAEKAAKAQELRSTWNEFVFLFKKVILSMDCTLADVNALEEYAAANKSKIMELAKTEDGIMESFLDSQKRIEAYRKFFDKNQNVAPLVEYFSYDQKVACKYYSYYWNIHKKNDPIRNFRYAAEKAKEMGIQ